MKSIGFPNMFQTTSTTRVVEDIKATTQNLHLLLGSQQGELICDPYFGLDFKGRLFEQNNYILKDIQINDIYSQTSIFMPQILITRNDITIKQDKGRLVADIKCINRADFTTNTYELVLLEGEIEQ